MWLAAAGIAAAAFGLVVGCSRAVEDRTARNAPSARTPDDERTDAVRAFEQSTRRALDFEHMPSSETTLGPDPWALAPLPATSAIAPLPATSALAPLPATSALAPLPATSAGVRLEPSRFVGVLRGRSQLVLLDAALSELARVPAPRAPTSLAVSADGHVFVAAGLGHTVARYTVRGDQLIASGVFDLGTEVLGVRELSFAAGKLYALDDMGGRIVVLDAATGRRLETLPACAGATQMKVAGSHVAVVCGFEHTLVVDGHVVFANNGPIWGFDAQETPAGLLIAAGGIEDHPLDRTEGSFGFIDSFLFVLEAGRRIAEINLSSHGVVTPKAVVIEGPGSFVVAGYGAPTIARVELAPGGAPHVEVTASLPGVRAIAKARGGWAGADPLLDAWVADGKAVPVADPAEAPRSTASRVGEALVFTTLMAPWNKSEGRLSRFTCETCHFEGYGDGRVHWTGRTDAHGAKVVASTKPLYGLAANKPHFSRALDPDLAAVAMNEFRVANAKSDHDPWFSIERREFPWIAALGPSADPLSPEELRRALVTFLVDFTHRPNPRTVGRRTFTDDERRGASVFREGCAGCHAPRLAADDPASEVPFPRWESLVFSDSGPLVWGKAEYAKTGIVPYVNERGARVPSLRRLYTKRPYFTNGSAADLDSVIARARWTDKGAFTHAGSEGRGLDERSLRALRAFLDLL
ncbi:hypothetical protein [Pendulispora albinea]|uniref:C-type cytochrome n=1 Tax=Pendulispora albinea TaxID=2741071 RepID=A0ABZ2LX56_9BACT